MDNASRDDLNLLRLQVSLDADEIAVQGVIQRAVDVDAYSNPPGSRLPGSAVLKALREMNPAQLRRVLWPGDLTL
jgi:hypothetical protein